MRARGMGWPVRSDPLGLGLAPALVLATGLVAAGCQKAPYVDGVATATPTTAAANGAASGRQGFDWSDPIDAKILIVDFTLTAPPTVFVVGQAYRLEIRNSVAADRTLVAPGFFAAIAVHQLVVASGKSRLEPVGFRADAMEALAFEATKIIAEMIPPGFETPIEEPPDNPFALTPHEGPGEDAAALGDALPDDPFALGAPAEDLPDDPFALGPPAEDLPADPFALGGGVAQIPAEDMIDLEPAAPADLPVNPFAAAEALEPAQQEPADADNAVEGDPEQFAEGLAVERAQAEVLALRTAEAAQAAAEAAALEAEAAAVAAAEAAAVAAAEAAAVAAAEAAAVAAAEAAIVAAEAVAIEVAEAFAPPESAPDPVTELAEELAPEVGPNIEADLAPDLVSAPKPEPIPEPEPIIPLDDAAELTMLAVWTAEAPKFSAPDGLAIPANSSVFLTFMPLKAGTFEVGDGSRLGALRAFGTITFVASLGGGERPSEAAPPAANLAMLIAEAKDEVTVTLPLHVAPVEAPLQATPSPAPAETPLLGPVVTVPIDPAPTPALDPPAVGDDPGVP